MEVRPRRPIYIFITFRRILSSTHKKLVLLFLRPKMTSSTILKKFGVLFWKFLLVKKNSWICTILTLLIPCVAMAILVYIRTQVEVNRRQIVVETSLFFIYNFRG